MDRVETASSPAPANREQGVFHSEENYVLPLKQRNKQAVPPMASDEGAERWLADRGAQVRQSTESPAESNGRTNEDSSQAMDLDEVDADVEVVCRPQKRGKEGGATGAEEAEGAEGVFHTRTMTVTCHCSVCRGSKEFTPSQFEAHGGLGCNKRWRTSIFVKQSDTESGDGSRSVTVGVWLKGLALDSDCRRSLQRQQRHKLMPPGWAAEYNDQKQGKKPCFLFKGSCKTCGKVRSVDRREHMEKFLNKHRHNPDWAQLTVDSFPWNMRSMNLDSATSASALEASSKRQSEHPEVSRHSHDEDDDHEDGEMEVDRSGRSGALRDDVPKPCLNLKSEDVVTQGTPPSATAEPSCKSCGATQTPQWRNGKTMCNACYLRERKDKMLGKRRSTAPAGFQYDLDANGMPYKPLQQRLTPTGLPWPLSHFANTAAISPRGGSPLRTAGGGAFHAPGAMGSGPGAGGLPASLASQLAQRHKFRRTDNFPANLYAGHHPMAGLLPPTAPPSFLTQAQAQQQQQMVAAMAAAAGKGSSPHGNERTGGGERGGPRGMMLPGGCGGGVGGSGGQGSSPGSSPQGKPTFSAEESILRQISMMDSGVGEAVAHCASAFAEARCNARDQGYEDGKEVWKSRLSQMLAEGGQPSEEVLGMPAELVEGVGQEQERRLLHHLHHFCSSLVQQWRQAQMHSIEGAHQEGQRMAREDVKKHLIELMQNDSRHHPRH